MSKPKKPRKCSVCRSIEHRADYHGSANDRRAMHKLDPLPPLDGHAAMRTMIDPFYAVWLVTYGSVGEALANATRKTHEARQQGFDVSDTLCQGLAELALRARDVDPALVAQAKELRDALDLATVKYRAVEIQITDKLGYPRSK